MIKKHAFLRSLGANIRNIRTAKGLTQDEVAELSEIDRTYFIRIERGERNPTIFKLYLIANALDVKLSDLFMFD